MVVACSGGADSLALLALAAAAGLDARGRARRPRRPSGQRRRGRPRGRRRRTARRPASPPSGSPSARAELRGPGPPRPLRGAGGGPGHGSGPTPCSSGTPGTTRPRRSCSISCGAGRSPDWRASRRRRGTIRRPLLGVPRADAWRDLCRARARSPRRPHEPGPRATAGCGSAVRSCRPGGRRRTGHRRAPGPHGEVARAESDLLDRLAAEALGRPRRPPGGRPLVAGLAPRLARPRVVRLWLGAPSVRGPMSTHVLGSPPGEARGRRPARADGGSTGRGGCSWSVTGAGGRPTASRRARSPSTLPGAADGFGRARSRPGSTRRPRALARRALDGGPRRRGRRPGSGPAACRRRASGSAARAGRAPKPVTDAAGRSGRPARTAPGHPVLAPGRWELLWVLGYRIDTASGCVSRPDDSCG